MLGVVLMTGCGTSALVVGGVPTLDAGGAADAGPPGDAGAADAPDAGAACTPAACDDQNPCTLDACGPAGCSHAPVRDGNACPSDGVFCNGSEVCLGGVCTAQGDPCPGRCQETLQLCGACAARSDCPADSATAWGVCGAFTDTCDEGGEEARTVTTWSCTSAQCVSSTQPERRGCSRATAGTSCGAATFGACQACAYDLGCGALGVGTRQGTVPLCQASACVPTAPSEGCTCAATACSGEALLYALPDLAAQVDAGVASLTWSVGGPAIPTGVTHAALWQTLEPVTATPTWDVGARTGFREAGAVVRGVSPTADSSAVQLGHRGVGLYLDTCSPGTTARDGIQPLTVAHELVGDLRPFADDTVYPELAFRFQAVLPTLTQKGGGVAYVGAVLRFTDKSRPVAAGRPPWDNDFWLFIQLADTRGAPQAEGVIGDACPSCSGLPIAITAPSGLAAPPRFVHAAPASAGRFSGAQPFSAWRDFDLRVSKDEFQRIIAAVAAYSPRGYSTTPADYALVHWNLNPEVYDPSLAQGSCTRATDPDWGTIGFGLRAVSLARVPWSSLPRIEYTGANAAGTGSGLQVFFLRSTSTTWTESKSLWGTLPAHGGAVTVRLNTLAQPEWRDAITALRVDPFNGTGAFAVDKLVVYGAGGAEVFRDEFTLDPASPSNPWTSNDITTWNLEANGTWWDGLAGGGGDPFFQRSVGPLATGR